jgi:hypothetical protein
MILAYPLFVALMTSYVPMFMLGYTAAGVCSLVISAMIYLGMAMMGFSDLKTMIGAFIVNTLIAVITYAIFL